MPIYKFPITRFLGIAFKGWSFLNVVPTLSLISIVLGSTDCSTSQSNWWSNDPRTKCVIRWPNGSPTQILRPAPKGISSKCCPFTSIFEPRNLSGLNVNGSSFQHSGSLPIAQTFTNTCVPFGTSYPMNLVSSTDFLGSRKGSGGCRRNVSFTTACRYGRLSMSLSSNFFSDPTTFEISAFAFSIASGMSTRISCSDNFSGSSFPLPLNSRSTLKKSFGFFLSSLALSFMRSFKNDEAIPIVIPVSRPIFLLNPCKSSNLRQGKMSEIFGRPDSSMILVMALKNSEVTSASGSAKSRDKTTFPSMLNDARKAKRATSTLPPRASFSIHISMSSTLFLLIAAVSFIFRPVNISALQTRRSTRQNAP
nr:RNA polymerase, subunit H/Rpb5, conserved site-containing protein [Ipomoea batatas]